MGNSNLLHNKACLTLQVNKEDKQLREIDIFFDWNEYIRLTILADLGQRQNNPEFQHV